MNRKAALLNVIITIVIISTFKHGFTIGECGAQFLKIGVGARASSLGESYVSIADDPSALYWNVAGIAQLEKYDLLVVQNFWLLDMSTQFVGFTLPSKFGNFGASALYSYSGKMDKYENFEKVGEYSAYDLALGVSYANKILENLYVGVTIKGIQQKIEEEDAQAVAGDIGVLYSFSFIKNLRIGMSINNIGKGIRFIAEEDPLPTIGRIGASYSHKFFIVTSDVTRSRDYNFIGNFGIEGILNNFIFLRAGYNTAKSFTLGTGISVWKFSLNYSYGYHNNFNLDGGHIIGLRTQF